MHTVYLLLGSNLGDSVTYIEKSRKLIEKEIGEITDKSSLYLTESWGKTGQPDFINQVVEVKSALKAEEILDKIIIIEAELGRERREKWGSRIIDIDILFYDDEIINKKDLTVPHPYLHQRRFTLAPLVELKPELFHPVLKKTMKELLETLKDNLFVQRLKNN